MSLLKTPSNDSDDKDETKITNKAEGDEDEKMDYTTSQLYDDVDIRLNKPVQADDETVQKEGTNAELTNIQQENENPEISQVIEDAHVTLSTIPQKTEVLVTSSSHSSDLASKFLNFLDILHTDAEIVSPMDVHVHHEVPSQQTTTLLTIHVSVITDSSPDDPLKTQVTALVDEHLDVRLGATRDEFMSYLLASITARITEQVKIQLPQILPKEVSNFAPPEIQRMVTKSFEEAVLAKEFSQPQSSYEAAATLTEFELKKILIDKMDKSESYLAAPEHRECYEGLIKSYDLDKTLFSTYDRGLKKRNTSKDAEPTKEESEFEVADSNMPQDQEGNLGNDDDEPMKETVSKRDWFTKPTQPQEPTDPDWNDGKTPQLGPTQSWLMTLASSADKPSKTFDELMSTPIDFSAYIMNGLKITNLTQETLLGPAFRLLKGTRTNYAELEYDFKEFMSGNRQKVPVDYFFNNDLKSLQGGVSTMTYTTSITKTKAAQYDLPGIEDMVLNIWVPVKVAYKHALWGISHWREQRNKETWVWYLKEIVVRRADNDIYRFKEGDFPHLRINDIEDMLLLVVQNRLTNLSGDDVSDFAIALRMFTRSLVIQKQVESYQKKINVTKPETTKPGIRKRDPYTPYQDP
ncbi:hypothetical protein Tco_0990066 [Tanacetum coccineum]|uniref:Uncharacterized protein n=1 Tax=Tanacetum coccineum TaxID=301880 RepID=A0ABQ5EWU9_9ASTR